MRNAIVAVALFVVAVACSNPVGTAPGVREDSAQIMRLISAMGVRCDGFVLVAPSPPAVERGECNNGELVITIYPGRAEAWAYITARPEAGGKSILSGANWMVESADVAALELARKILGGSLYAQTSPAE